MKTDPSERRETYTVHLPPATGSGSGKAAWQALAERVLESNDSLARMLDEASAAIRERDAEIALLKTQIAERRPRGGRAAVPEETVSRIERALGEPGASTRSVARQFGVSAMTVSRVASRMKARA